MLTVRKILDRKRLRLKDHDYSGSYSYFVTICVQDRINGFGEIVNNKMIMNDYGNIANRQFEWLKNQYPYIGIPVWIVMPNHIHAIVRIYNSDRITNGSSATKYNTPEYLNTSRIIP